MRYAIIRRRAIGTGYSAMPGWLCPDLICIAGCPLADSLRIYRSRKYERTTDRRFRSRHINAKSLLALDTATPSAKGGTSYYSFFFVSCPGNGATTDRLWQHARYANFYPSCLNRYVSFLRTIGH